MGYDKINIKNIFKSKSIPLIILMVIACCLFSGSLTLIVPSLLFVGIIGALASKLSLSETVLSSFIGFFVGYLISIIVSLINIYFTGDPLDAIGLIQYSMVSIFLYVFIGCVGSALGYHIKEEIRS